MPTKEEEKKVKRRIKKAYEDGFFAGYAEGGRRERLARLKKFITLEDGFWQTYVKNLKSKPEKRKEEKENA